MSIRIKILLVLVLGIGVALTVSVLAYVNAQQLDRDVELILSQDLRAVQSLSEAREALREIGEAEDRMLSWKEARYKTDIDQSMRVLVEGLETGRGLSEDVEEADRYQELLASADVYEKGLDRLAEELRAADGRLTNRLRSVQLTASRTRSELDSLKRALSLLEVEGTPPVGETPGVAAVSWTSEMEQIEKVREELEALTEVSLSAPDAALLEKQIGEAVEARSSRVRAWWRKVALQLLERGQSSAVAVLEPQFAALEQDASELKSAVVAYVRSVGELRRENKGMMTSIERGLSELSQQSWRALETKRASIGERRTLAIRVIVVILVLGLLLVGILGVVMTRGLTGSVRALLDAARAIRQGELDTHVTIRTRDEFHELAEAFNAMAYYLKARRKQQTDYNEIVSLLNSSLSLADIVSGSLQEVIERSDSLAGSVFLFEPQSAELVLKDTYALTEEAMQRKRFALGEGLVGQAARTRRKIVVNPVPEGLFDVDLGVGLGHPQMVLVLPVVHVERLLGVFVLVTGEVYDEERLTFIEEVVFQVGVTLNNVRFVETIEETARALREKTEELIEQQARLENVNSELEDANRLKDDFLANVTHELRTPLNAIIGFTELVMGREDLGHKPRRHLETVLRNARSLLAMINDLLDITKIEAGKTTLSTERVELDELVEECLQTVRPMVEEGVEIESRLEPNLPPLVTDRGKLRQMMLNLLSNAAKFTEEGAIRVDVRRISATEMEIAVIDSGIGIHEEDLPFIFDKFRQVDGSSSRKYGGTGLGLTITAELVRLLGGTITARSEVGGGSTFKVVMPLSLRMGDAVEPVPTHEPVPVRRERARTAPEMAALRQSVSGVNGVEAKRSTIVVVDDEPGSVVGLRTGLRSEEYQVVSAFIYGDAVRWLEEDVAPRVVVLGRPLPEDDAEEKLGVLLEKIGERNVDVVRLAGGPQLAGVQVLGTLERPMAPENLLEMLEG